MDLKIQIESPEHYQAIHDILISCFKSDAEAKLVSALRENNKAVLSLVALEADEVVGHIMFSPVTTSPLTNAMGLGLAPLVVKSKFQKQGIGGILIQEGLLLCKEMGYDYVVLLGNPNYYQRFGFIKASDFGIKNEYGVDEPFMLIQLASSEVPSGLVRYCEEFFLFSV
jgi:putative acetyltransferase